MERLKYDQIWAYHQNLMAFEDVCKGAFHRQKIPVKILDFCQKSDVLEIDFWKWVAGKFRFIQKSYTNVGYKIQEVWYDYLHNRQKRRSVTGPWLFVNFVYIEIVCNYAACLSTLKEQKATKTKCPL